MGHYTPALKWQGVPSKDPQIIWIPLIGLISWFYWILYSLIDGSSERSEHHRNEVTMRGCDTSELVLK